MKTQALVDDIASDLNDSEDGHAYQTWTADQIRVWVAEGVNLIFDKRPDLFMERKVIQVQACSLIQDTCDCEVIRRVIGQVTEKGRMIRPLRERGLEIGFQWLGKPCRKPLRGGETFPLESYAIDKVTDLLYIWPEVPPHVDVYVEVECAVRPDENAVRSEVSDRYSTAVKQWVLWRAKGMDMEISQAALSAAQLHYKAFFDVLGLATETQQVIHKREST